MSTETVEGFFIDPEGRVHASGLGTMLSYNLTTAEMRALAADLIRAAEALEKSGRTSPFPLPPAETDQARH